MVGFLFSVPILVGHGSALGWYAPFGSTVAVFYRFDRMTVAGKARVICKDMFEITCELLIDDASLGSGGNMAGKIPILNGGTISP